MVIGHIKTSFGLATVILKQYANNNATAIVLQDSDGCAIGALSVNVPEAALRDGDILIKTWSENQEISQAALESGLFEDTGRRVKTGWVEAHVWRLKIPVPMQCYDACMVQNACNPSGILNSFTRLWEMEQFGPASPIAFMYASKLCAIGCIDDTNETPKHAWFEVLNMAKAVFDELKGQNSISQALADSFQELCRELSAWTHCNNPNVTNVVFPRVASMADWRGKEDQRDAFTSTYCRSTASV